MDKPGQTNSSAMAFGWRAYGLGVMAIGVVCLAWRDFEPGEAVPTNLPDRVVLACIADLLVIVASAAVLWRRSAAWGAAALAVYFGVFVVVLMNGQVILANYTVYGAYSSCAEELALAAAGVIVYARFAAIDAVVHARITRASQVTFGVCAVLFGGAHFFYMNLTAPLVPKWLPPSQVFWGYATGVFHIAAGVAILAGVQARLATILLTIMYASFTPLVHVPILLGDHASYFNWTENALNLALTGAAWAVADSLGRQKVGGSIFFGKKEAKNF